MTTVAKLPATLILLTLLALWADATVATYDSDEARDIAFFGDGKELTFEDLFRRASIRHAALSPNGELVAYFRYNMLVMGKPGAGYSDITKFHSRLSIQELVWTGHNTVWVESWDAKNNRVYGTAVRFSDLGSEGYDQLQDHINPGYISERLPEDPDRIILARPRFEDDRLAADLYRIDLFEPIDGQLTTANRIDTGSEDFLYYGRNSVGDYTLGIRFAEGVPQIWRKNPGAELWEHIWTANRESAFLPVHMSDDAKTMWVLSDAETDRVVAAEFDLENGVFRDVLYQHDRVDVEDLIMDEDGQTPIGVIFTEQGLLRYHFFSAQAKAEFERLRSYLPGKGIILIGYAGGSDTRLVFASSPTERGSIHICNLASDQCDLVESIAPWLDEKPISAAIAIDVPSTDGFTVEAFLTMPSNTRVSVPLIALPHGGPIGISDDRYFSSEVQWLAANGYAVLQVNYRGSAGYGGQFMKAGLRQWGRGIEDDIEAAVHKVLLDHPGIDRDRVGIFGGSYGGYSAIMSVIRNPELFKCAASFAGVMDLTLLFTESAAKQHEYLRDILIEYVGDPDVDYQEQVEHSPVYRYKDIKRPVLLGHGLVDTVVDFEHSWRLHSMLRLAGGETSFVPLKRVGHGFDYINQAKDFYEPLLEFLDTHLKPAR